MTEDDAENEQSFCVIIEEKKTPMRVESNQVNKHS